MIPLVLVPDFCRAAVCHWLYGVLARKNSVAILMGIELMLNAVNVNLLAFWRYLYSPTGRMQRCLSSSSWRLPRRKLWLAWR
jgi:hypothetical protein